MKDTVIKIIIAVVIIDIMCLILVCCCGCQGPREIYTRQFQLYGQQGDTSAVMYHGNKFVINRDTVTRTNEFGDSYSYPKNRVKVQHGSIAITDSRFTTIYR